MRMTFGTGVKRERLEVCLAVIGSLRRIAFAYALTSVVLVMLALTLFIVRAAVTPNNGDALTWDASAATSTWTSGSNASTVVWYDNTQNDTTNLRLTSDQSKGYHFTFAGVGTNSTVAPTSMTITAADLFALSITLQNNFNSTNTLTIGNGSTTGASSMTMGRNGSSGSGAAWTITNSATSGSVTYNSNNGGTAGTTFKLYTSGTVSVASGGPLTLALPMVDSDVNHTGGITKTGSGNLTVSGANTYTGGTSIAAGTLTCGATNTLPSGGALTLNGGTLSTGGFSQSTGTGSLLLTANSTIALGSGDHSLHFADSHSASWTASTTLTITGWQGTFNGSSSGTAGKIFVGSDNLGLSSTQLSQILFYDGSSHLYPAVILSTGEVVPGSTPTDVKLMEFSAVRYGKGVVLQWRSGFEAHNLGYNIYREENGARTLITPSLVAGSALMIGQRANLTAGYSYAWFDSLDVDRRENRAVRYWLEDVDLSGVSSLHGPAVVVEGRFKRGGANGQTTERSPMLNELGVDALSSRVSISGWPTTGADRTDSKNRDGEAPVPALSNQETIASTSGVKLKISKPGWYRVTQSELLAAGLDALISPSHLQMFANGQEVPIEISGNGAQFTSSDYIEFFGRVSESPTDNQQTYFLFAGNTPGKRIERIDSGQLSEPSGPGSFVYTVERKDRAIYYSAYLNGDAENIFGPVVNNKPLVLSIPVSHQYFEPDAQVTIEISLVGVSFEDHHVKATLNGVELGTIDFGMTGHPSQTFTIPASVVHDGDNSLELVSLGGSSDVSLADTLRLTYAHSYKADNNVLSMSVTSDSTLRIHGFTDANVRVIDVTDAHDMKELTPLISVKSDGAKSVDIRVADASPAQPHTLYIFGDSQISQPDSLRRNNPSSWRSSTNAADYLIITSTEFLSSAQTLAQYRRSQGLIVNVIDVEDAFDEFSFGDHTPAAIRKLLEVAAASWARKPRYVLLMGDASYDPKNYLGQGSTDFVPTKLIDTTMMETASDDWLADFDGDGVANLAIGRLPVRTAADAEVLVNKIINYETTPFDPKRGALLVADNSFEASSKVVENLLPSFMPRQAINRSAASDSTIHAQIIEAINQGPWAVNYFGHGSNGVWTGARLLSNVDAPNLTNANRLSLFVMMTCLNGYFVDAYNDSLAESLLRASTGGAVAVWASTGTTDPSSQNQIGQSFYRQLFSSDAQALGDAVRLAKLATNDADVRRTWTLFADPATRLAVQVTPTTTKGKITGAITDNSGQPLAGVTIGLSGKQNRQTITDVNGNFSFNDVETNSFCTVTPSRPNYSFLPTSSSFNLLGSHAEASFVGVTTDGSQINPLDTTDFFVRQQYLDFLGREPDEPGLAFWTKNIESCGADANCREAKRVDTSAAFFLSIEFQRAGYLVYRTYKVAFGDLPNSPVPLTISEFTPDHQALANGVVVGREGWQLVLENNTAGFMTDFVKRSQFVADYPTTLSPAEFVDRLFGNAAVSPSSDERAAAVSEFGAAETSADLAARARALRRIAENPALAQQEMNRAFVLMQYFGYLRRNPNDAPEPAKNFDGYNFWLNKLNQFNGSYFAAEMVKAFLTSAEYRARFSR